MNTKPLIPNRFLWPGLLLVLAFWGTACQSDPYAPEYTRKRPNPTDLVGDYVMQEQTLVQGEYRDLEARDGKKAGGTCLILLPDGTFFLSRFPDWEYAPNPKTNDPFTARTFQDLEGRWEITKTGFINDGKEQFSEMWGLVLKSEDNTILQAALLGTKPPYRIAFQYEDPDSGYAMILQKAVGK